jgi:hypothetical protein
MTLTAQIRASVDARRTTQSGLATGVEVKPISIGVDAGDCDIVYAERRTFGAIGYDEIDFATGGLAVVKLLFVKNLSETSAIGLSAGWNGTQFSIFRQDVTSWNFSPMVNLGSLTLRGFPIRPLGAWLLSCPNSDGFGATVGGSILRVGGVPSERYEFYAMGT